MNEYEVIMSTIALSMGAAWASGINLYLALLVLGLGGASGNIALPAELTVLQDPMVIGAAGLMYFIEFFTDKMPGVDSGWDALHTFIRLPAGALLAASSVGEVTPALEITAGILGGGMAAATHATKAGTRLMINTSPEPFTNWTASVGEDVAVVGGLWGALHYPEAFLIFLAVFLIAMIFLLPKIWRGVKLIFRKLGELLGLVKPQMQPETPAASALVLNEDLEPLDKLARLKQLLDNGAISEAEFTTQKAHLLTVATEDTMPNTTPNTTPDTTSDKPNNANPA